ncbi:hypothetical protein E3E12_03055 [Formicincola oecophyllae]|uniref:Uncharacterized protein n=2 Tax=Formicincola oecophyllae TaxID=2558361 RepID=A0A4Y6UCM9_9PROT|nr:hypothetical protein E3E12_03055 [Formicincola oecophyllae]
MVVTALLVSMITGTLGKWYLIWLLGTPLCCLVAGAGAILFDTQVEAGRRGMLASDPAFTRED